MAEFPALPLWTDAYLGDTTHLSTIEHGAYLLLLMTAWRTRDCALPDDDRLLARYARLDARQWKRMKPIIAEFFVVEGGQWRQRRLDDEREAVMTYKQKQSEKGKSGARAKSLKRHERTEAAAKFGCDPAEAQDKQDASSLLHSTLSSPNGESNAASGENSDPGKQFWDSAKAYLGKNRSSLIGKWVRDYGQEATAAAISAAQVERAVNPVEFIQGRFRKNEQNASAWDGMP